MPPYDIKLVQYYLENYSLSELGARLHWAKCQEIDAKKHGASKGSVTNSMNEAIKRLKNGVI